MGRFFCAWAVALSALASFGSASAADKKVEFNRDVRPILADKCFACHGPDTKKVKGGLRLDVAELAKQEGDGGHVALVAGKPEMSEAIRRITSSDPAKVMPPPSAKKTLSAAEKQTLRDWIAQGAEYQAHWAYVVPVKHAPPAVKNPAWIKNAIDHFILARLEKEGLTPNGEADAIALLRRVTLDLTGLPPTPAEVDEFIVDGGFSMVDFNDKSKVESRKSKIDAAYEKAVDRLLKSPRYGEHMARYWLDAARYGDTHGMHLDNYREMYPYREWVIKAFNRNMPFDRFLIEQIAGDLLPDTKLEQQIATGFLRCHVTTSEGGSIEEEVYVRNVVDRIDTNGLVLFGLTVGCARCHHHPYDPVSAKEYYQLFAFFNNLDGSPLDGNIARHPPVVSVPTAEQAARMDSLKKQIAGLEKEVDQVLAKLKYDPGLDAKPAPPVKLADFVWIDDALPAGVKAVTEWEFVAAGPREIGEQVHQVQPRRPGAGRSAGGQARPARRQGGQALRPRLSRPRFAAARDHAAMAQRRLEPPSLLGREPHPLGRRQHAGAAPHRRPARQGGVGPARSGCGPRRPQAGHGHQRLGLHAARRHRLLGPGRPRHAHAAGRRAVRDPHRLAAVSALDRRQGLAQADPGPRQAGPQEALGRSEENAARLLRAQCLERRPRGPQAGPGQARALTQERDQLDKDIPTTLVFKERADPRPAYFLKRGEYEQRGDKVERGTPAFLPALDEKAPRNRLGFAQWLVDPKHPLTARVAVNRLWQQVFGSGLVKTAEDFGIQGESPSHPELLDWLALTFIEDGWDVQQFMKRIVVSATYRQSPRITPQHLAKDRDNRLLARGARYRLDAEMLRDQALFVSGLLVEKLGGPSVKPPQPAGLWEAVAFTGSNTGKFSPDKGHDKVHRRSMYIFWKRTAAPPMMTALDAPSREACTVRRERTNTPLQALLLMNEEQYVEASRVLAERILKQEMPSLEARLQRLFRTVTCRPADPSELAELKSLLEDHLTRYAQDAKAAQALISVGETRPDAALNPSELAAWTLVANLVLNLDEVVMK